MAMILEMEEDFILYKVVENVERFVNNEKSPLLLSNNTCQ